MLRAILLLMMISFISSLSSPGRKARIGDVPKDTYTEIPILLNNDEVFVIDKPPGTSYHNDNSSLGILNTLRQLYPDQRLYGVHRLDRVTSGILVFAKTPEVASSLARAFRERKVIKYYTGISLLKAKKKQGLVQGNMVRSRRKAWALTREKGDNFAKTRFYTSSLGDLNEHLLDMERSPKTVILFHPTTGRTHQLRVAAKSVGLALAGDPVYSDGTDYKDLDRTYLHSTGILIPESDGNSEVCVWHPPTVEFWDEVGEQLFYSKLERLAERYCEHDAFLPHILQ